MQIMTINLFLLICKRLSVTCLLLGAALMAQAGDFDAGVFEFQKKLADNGNPQAQFKLGNMYETGRSVGMDPGAARQWYEKAAANNFKPAKNRLTYLQVKRNGFKLEHKSWLSEVLADANDGDGEASMILGEMYEQGIGMPKNLAQAQTEYKRATVKGIAGSEIAYYAVTDLINRQKQAQQDEEKQILADRARKEEADQTLRKKTQQEQDQLKQAQLKAEAEQRKQEEDRLRIEAQKRQLNEQKEQSAALYKQKQAEAAGKSAVETPPPAETFESDLCTGKAASFRTQCR